MFTLNKKSIMRNLRVERLGEIALNTTKPLQAIKARSYLLRKGNQLLGYYPKSLAEAVVTIIKHRREN